MPSLPSEIQPCSPAWSFVPGTGLELSSCIAPRPLPVSQLGTGVKPSSSPACPLAYLSDIPCKLDAVLDLHMKTLVLERGRDLSKDTQMLPGKWG